MNQALAWALALLTCSQDDAGRAGRLASLVKALEGAEAEHSRAQKALHKQEEALADRQAQLEAARAEGREADAARPEQQAEPLRKAVAAGRKRVDLAVKERTTLRDIANSLRARVEVNQQLVGPPHPGPAAADSTQAQQQQQQQKAAPPRAEAA